jgi:hypothetical protein
MSVHFSISEEQRKILEQAQAGRNVIVDSCAGAGKSSTIVCVAKELRAKSFLHITYNSMLRTEFKEKTKLLGIDNIEVHTYHSLAVKYFLRSAQTDTGIRRILHTKMRPITPIEKYDVVVIDEAQDCTLLYYHFVVYFAQCMARKFQLIVLGDYLQRIYEFKGADSRFLTEAEDIWRGFSLLASDEFAHCTLHMSYRITNQMANFVNDVMLGEPRVMACRDGQNVSYVRNNRSTIERIVVYNIKKLIAEGASPSDFFVLGASVKGMNSNIRKMENVLVESGIPCLVPMFENDKLDERVIDGKVVFATFHTAKGRQRKYVFVVGFDNSYFTFFSRGLDRNVCPNTLYVACTRATEALFLLEADQYPTDRPLEFLKLGHNEMRNCAYIDFKGTPKNIFYKKIEGANQEKTSKHFITPTELIKFVPEAVVEEVSPILDRIFVKESAEDQECEFEIPTVIRTKNGFYEDVSDLNGIAIPIIYYDHIHSSWKDVKVSMQQLNVDVENGGGEEGGAYADFYQDFLPRVLENVSERVSCGDAAASREPARESAEGEGGEGESHNILYKIIEANVRDMKANDHIFLKRIFRELSPVCKSSADYLYMSNVYESVHERLYFKLKQIDKSEYNWLSPEIVGKCKDRLDGVLGSECAAERPAIEKTIISSDEDLKHFEIDAKLAPHFGENEKFRFTARTDIITKTAIWELKCTSAITIDHLLQVVIYAWLWKHIHAGEPAEAKTSKIFNIKTGEILRMDATGEDLDAVMVALLKGKYGKREETSDQDFIANCRRIHAEK